MAAWSIHNDTGLVQTISGSGCQVTQLIKVWMQDHSSVYCFNIIYDMTEGIPALSQALYCISTLDGRRCIILLFKLQVGNNYRRWHITEVAYDVTTLSWWGVTFANYLPRECFFMDLNGQWNAIPQDKCFAASGFWNPLLMWPSTQRAGGTQFCWLIAEWHLTHLEEQTVSLVCLCFNTEHKFTGPRKDDTQHLFGQCYCSGNSGATGVSDLTNQAGDG